MSLLQFLCPRCESLLRMRPEQVAEMPQFECPACHRTIEVVAGPQGVKATPVEVPAATSASQAESGSPAPEGSTAKPAASLVTRHVAKSDSSSGRSESSSSRLDRLVKRANSTPVKKPARERASSAAPMGAVPWYLSPLVIAWASAAGFAAALLGYVLWQNSLDRTPGSVGVPDVAKVPQDNAPRSKPADDKGIGKSPPTRVLGTDSRERLSALGVALQKHLATEGSFPAGTWPAANLPVERRFSWLAKMVESQGWQSPMPVFWDRAWNHPLSESFVRRRIPELQNPSVGQLTGGDGYPATHFAGMAGVGSDAATLRADDPRAGIFGDERRTRARDVVDGLSNTIIVAGVREQLGSWASGGPATVRGLSREPYVNGPDGFGTGQVRGMLVLMADGSVREVSSDTAPAIVRQMVTVADDRKLPAPRRPDPAVPDLPGGTPPAVKPAPEVADAAGEDVPPLVPAPPPAAPDMKQPPDADGKQGAPPVRKPRIVVEPVVPKAALGGAPVVNKPVRKINAETALRIKLLRYQRDEAVPLTTILDEIAEMSGIDIVCEPGVLGEAGMNRLRSRITLNLAVVTIRDVLSTALQKAELTFKLDRGQIHVVLPSDSP